MKIVRIFCYFFRLNSRGYINHQIGMSPRGDVGVFDRARGPVPLSANITEIFVGFLGSGPCGSMNFSLFFADQDQFEKSDSGGSMGMCVCVCACV